MIGEGAPQSNAKNILLDEVERILRAHESGERPAPPELLETAHRLKAKYGLAEGARENTPPTQPAAPERRPSSERSASSFNTEQDPRPPWFPWPGESGPAYEAFTCYLKSPSWSVRDVAEHLGRTYSSVKALAHRWCWAARRRAWQAHLIEVWTEEQEEQTIRTAGRRTMRP